jgi:hypothetical protein
MVASRTAPSTVRARSDRITREAQPKTLDPRPHVICRPQPDQLRAEQRGLR